MNTELNKKLKLVAQQIGMEITDEEILLASQSLSELQINELSDSLESHRSESSKNLLLLPSNNEGKFTEEYNKYIEQFKQDCEGKEFKAVVTLNASGLEQISMVKEVTEFPELVPDYTLDLDQVFENEVAVNKDKVLNDIKGDMMISDEDASIMFDIMNSKDYREQNIFSLLPESVKGMVMQNIPNKDPKLMNEFAIFLVDEMKKSLILEQQIIDLNTSVKKEMEMEGLQGELIDEFNNFTLGKFEELKEKAYHSGNKTKIKQVEKSLVNYQLSRSFEFIKDVKNFNIGRKKFTKKKFLEEQVRYIKQYCTEFNARYKTHKFAIDDINTVELVLHHVLPEVHIDDVRKFVILFCMYSKSLKVNNPEDHVLMYYTIKNIIMLYDIKDKENSEFFKEITENLKETIRYINQ